MLVVCNSEAEAPENNARTEHANQNGLTDSADTAHLNSTELRQFAACSAEDNARVAGGDIELMQQFSGTIDIQDNRMEVRAAGSRVSDAIAIQGNNASLMELEGSENRTVSSTDIELTRQFSDAMATQNNSDNRRAFASQISGTIDTENNDAYGVELERPRRHGYENILLDYI